MAVAWQWHGKRAPVAADTHDNIRITGSGVFCAVCAKAM
jgi:hypothetical protein